MIKLLESNKSRKTKDENGENETHLEINELILLYFDIVSNNYQRKLRVLYTFVPDK